MHRLLVSISLASTWICRSVISGARPSGRRSVSSNSMTVDKAGPQSAEHEERRIFGRVPAGCGGAGEIQADDRMHGNDQRRHDRRQRAVGRLQVPPLRSGAAEAHGEEPIDHLPGSPLARSRIVARSGITPRYQNSTEATT